MPADDKYQRYNASEKGKARHKRYRESPKGRASRAEQNARYRTTLGGFLSEVRHQGRRREEA
ncbi:MAG TPA: hypothetical protein VE990_12440 [Acidimicrobiales bacterium]|nr:hypothetical protein [Acidimicrobiales bacterium]